MTCYGRSEDVVVTLCVGRTFCCGNFPSLLFVCGECCNWFTERINWAGLLVFCILSSKTYVFEDKLTVHWSV